MKPRGTGVVASRRECPQSTNVSSPVQAMSRRRKAIIENDEEQFALHNNGYERDDFVVSDRDCHKVGESDDEDAFEPIREAGQITRSRKRKLGPPITTDEKLDRLNETHRMVVEDFMIHAKSESSKVRPIVI